MARLLSNRRIGDKAIPEILFKIAILTVVSELKPYVAGREPFANPSHSDAPAFRGAAAERTINPVRLWRPIRVLSSC